MEHRFRSLQMMQMLLITTIFRLVLFIIKVLANTVQIAMDIILYLHLKLEAIMKIQNASLLFLFSKAVLLSTEHKQVALGKSG